MYRPFLEHIRDTFEPAIAAQIVCALRRAAFLMRGERRYDGVPMMLHAAATADIVCAEIGLGRDAVIASLLHDVARLGKLTGGEIVTRYGRDVWEILRGMNSISAVDAKVSTLQVGNFRELIISYSSDPRVILIKIADRLEVMRSLAIFPELKRNKKSWETLHLYASLAHKLGLYNIKSELEDLALSYLEPRDYAHITRRLSETAAERELFIADFVRPIRQKLESLGIVFELKTRTKSIYSIWRKMKRQRVSFDEVFDIFAIRIIVDCPAQVEKMQCWTVFSVVTDFYLHNPARMRDWVTIPKSNGYESLHATVVTTGGQWVEVQIRTRRMNTVAEHGVAAHWKYKGVTEGGLSSEQWLERLRGIVENTNHDDALNEEFDITLSTDELFIFTPQGDLRKLPEGASVLDFAFDIHTNLGVACTGGRVNGRKVPIREKLRSGDIVEISTNKNQRPKTDWLSFVVTNKAKAKIRQALREEQVSSANLGREELERKLKNWKMPLTIEEAVTALTKHFKVKTGLEIYSMISEQRVQMAEIKEILSNIISGNVPLAEAKPRKESTATKIARSELVINDTLKGVDYKYAKCCNPIFGDDVFGFVTINSGVTIHRNDCPNAASLLQRYPYRMVEVQWGANRGSGIFSAVIRLRGEDRIGLANRITDIVTNQLRVNVRSLSLSSDGGRVEGTLVVEVTNSDIVDMVVNNLRKIDSLKVERAK